MEGGICAGCRRTLDEIALWGNASDAEKRRILAAVARRTGGPNSEGSVSPPTPGA
jgi:predicted Fe-S protein YdhL (DUF1289 family)